LVGVKPSIYCVRVTRLQQSSERDLATAHTISDLENSGCPFTDIWLLVVIADLFQLASPFRRERDSQWIGHIGHLH